MALPFSESTNKTGMYELFQDLTFTNTSSYPIAKFTRDANNAYANFFMLAIRASGKWQVDDNNQTDYPELKVNLTSGQFDYSFTTDAASTPNQILEIERVEIATDATGAIFEVLEPYDEVKDDESIVYNRTITGIPYRYSKRATGLFLDPTPNYSCANGIRVFLSRTPIYFLSTDTTKKAGIPDFFHEYLVYRPAYLYAVAKLPKLAAGYLAFLNKMERDIGIYYASRNKDEHRGISTASISFR